MTSQGDASPAGTAGTVDGSPDAAGVPDSRSVEPHTTHVVAWDVPSSIVAGERFTMRVGIKCAHDCVLAGSGFVIHDHEGARVATGALAADVLPGTTGLYVAQVELEAPRAEGLFTWKAVGPSTALGPGPSARAATGPPTTPGAGAEPEVEIAHAEGSVDFGVRVVKQPDCLVTVEAVDAVSQTPLCGAHLVMHPYRAVTDERGIAEVRVATGAYRLFVSYSRYLTFALPVEVTADTTVRAELDVEPEPERN
jgi:hypothetical protein